MEINLVRKNNKFNFEATGPEGHIVNIDANPQIGGEGKGFRPMEMLLIGLGGCSGIDMVNVLDKQKEPLKDISIKITATRKTDEVPAIFESVNVHFDLYGQLNLQKVERALSLTFEKYCSVANIIGRSATITFSYAVHEAVQSV